PVANQLTLGAPPECPQRPFCLEGLRDTYGILFWDFVPLDAGGPQTVEALKNNDVQVALLFSTDPSIEANGFVPLQDDKHLQDAENITPVIRTAVLNNEVQRLLDGVSAALTTENVTALIGKVVLDGQQIPRVSAEPSGTGSFLVHAVYPKSQSNCKHVHTARFRARYPGALSVKSADDGTLSLVVTLPFEKYLDGIAEVPPTWPAAALEAQ